MKILYEYCCLNGQLRFHDDCLISPNDRGLLLGDGLFETLKVQQGQPLLLANHWQRLQQSCQCLSLALPWSLSDIKTLISELVKANHALSHDTVLRITVTRGAGDRGLALPVTQSPTLLLSLHEMAMISSIPISLIISNIRRNQYSPLANLKSLNYLDNILAFQQAVQQNANDALLLNTDGHVACTSKANIFLVCDQQLLTPPLGDGVIPGITRQIILTIANQLSMACFEQSIALEEMQNADEVFITNSLCGILAVKQINNKIINHSDSSSITALLQTHYQNYLLTAL